MLMNHINIMVHHIYKYTTLCKQMTDVNTCKESFTDC